MFYAVVFFCTFCVVESVCCTYKVTCDSTDSFKFHAFTYYCTICCCIRIPEFFSSHVQSLLP